MEIVQAQYARQAASLDNTVLPSRFVDPGSLDAWHHDRMLSYAKPLVQAFPDSEWMTVGDGRFGSDAAYLASLGVRVTATNLTDESLREAALRGYIRAYRAENAESLSAPDDSVDFVLCKEAYHHLPRPPVGLYEMLRVARRGVVLIEPADSQGVLSGAKRALKTLLRGDQEFEYEPAGNYIYRITPREIFKLVAAMGSGPAIAYRGLNTCYLPRFAGHRADRLNTGTLITRAGLAAQDIAAGMGLFGYGLYAVVVIKTDPQSTLRNALRDARFRVMDVPPNPYA